MSIVGIMLALLLGFLVTLGLAVGWVLQLSKKQAEFELKTRNKGND